MQIYRFEAIAIPSIYSEAVFELEIIAISIETCNFLNSYSHFINVWSINKYISCFINHQ